MSEKKLLPNICALFKDGHCIESDFLSYWSHGKVVCKRSQILVAHQIYNPDVSSNQHIQCTIFQLLVLTLMCKLILLTHNILRRTMRQVVSFKGLTLLWVTSKVSLWFFPARSVYMDRHGNVPHFPKLQLVLFPTHKLSLEIFYSRRIFLVIIFWKSLQYKFLKHGEGGRPFGDFIQFWR